MTDLFDKPARWGIVNDRVCVYVFCCCYFFNVFNPITAAACKISGLKDARTCLQTVYVLGL